MSLPLKQLEELSLTHWPALNTEYMDGWKLRMANGYTKRANCISTLKSTSKQLHANIASCEQVYSSVKQPTIFKVTPFSEPQLDETLEKLDYTMLDPSLMLTLDLKQLPHTEPKVKLNENDALELSLQEHISLRWLEQYCEHSGVDPHYIPTMIDMIAAMPGQVLLASSLLNGETVALAMAVIDQGVVGIYDVITATPYRNLGLCSHLLWHVLQQCKTQASFSYLAVLESNATALSVYSKLGFKHAYHYWYRIKS